MARYEKKLGSEIKDVARNRPTRRAVLAGTGAAVMAAALPAGAARAEPPLGRPRPRGRVARPQWWGAKADGVHDDTEAINAAIQAMYDAGGGTVLLTPGTYLLGTVTPSADPEFSRANTLIVPKSHVNIVGTGDRAVLKAADGLTEKGQWNFIHPPNSAPENPLTDVVYRNFKVDGNGENNLNDEQHKTWNAISTRFGSRITIDNLTFVNNAGRQCLQFGNNEMPHTVTDLVIRNCRFDTVGGAVPGNETNDHSSIYAQANGCVIENNVCIQPELDFDNISTAIEVHASNAIVTGNRIINYRGGINVVATVTDHVNVTYTDNVILGCWRAFMFWCQNDRVMDGVRIADNTIEQVTPLPSWNPALFALFPIIGRNVRQPIGSLTIEDNTLSYGGDTEFPFEKNRARGIDILKCHDLKITNNRIIGTLGSAIGHMGTDGAFIDDQQSVEIVGNRIENCGRGPNGADDDSRTAIVFNHGPGSRTAMSFLRVEDNSINNTGDQPGMERGVYGTLDLAEGLIVDNTMDGTTTDLSWDSEAVITQLHVEHVGSGSPEGVVRASVGSVYTNNDTGETWDKVSGDTTAEGWELR